VLQTIQISTTTSLEAGKPIDTWFVFIYADYEYLTSMRKQFVEEYEKFEATEGNSPQEPFFILRRGDKEVSVQTYLPPPRPSAKPTRLVFERDIEEFLSLQDNYFVYSVIKVIMSLGVKHLGTRKHMENSTLCLPRSKA
jgi:hypothetical protein